MLKENNVTNNTSCGWLLHENCQTQVSYLNFSMVSIHKNVVTFQVFMDNRWIVTMKVYQALKYLFSPIFYGFHINISMSFTISVNQINIIIPYILQLNNIKEEDDRFNRTYCLKFPNVHSSIIMLMVFFLPSIQELKNFMIFSCFRDFNRLTSE